MSPVHVIVGEDQRAEAMWANAFTGAVDLYRFPRNVDAFERLTAAEAAVDLVVLTPAQRGPFNLTPDQFIARVLDGPLGSSRHLAGLHIIVVGQPITREHPRVMGVSTLDAAIRLVKFGEIERAPRPAAVLPVAAQRRDSTTDVDAILGEAAFAGSVISRIWDAPAAREAGQQAPTPAQRPEVVGGGSAAPARAHAAPVEPVAILEAHGAPADRQLFTRSAPAGFIVGSSATPQSAAAALDALPAQVGAPGEVIEVSTGALQPVRPYQLPHGAGYRGPAVRGGHVHAAGHTAPGGGQPVPPALASQVQSMVYGGMVGNPSDPLLTWSSGTRSASAPVPGANQPPQAQPPAGVNMAAPHVAQPVAQPVQAHAPLHAPHGQPQPVRMVPMEPPAGAYGAPAAAAAPPADPFLQRAEQGGAAVAFG